jgi:putative SOS response-associated peptidase YedK
MCGRYGRRGDKQKIAEAFHASAGLDDVEIPDDPDCAPGSLQPVVAFDGSGERALSVMRWGFKLPDRLLFNTRSEGIERANFWKKMFAEHRCLIPASSFYEWEKLRDGCKPKYEITVPGRDLFGLAGVWSRWRNPRSEQWEDTFSILTSIPNATIQRIHDRQPIVVDSRDFEEWLTPAQRPPVHLLSVLPEQQMKLVPLDDASRPVPSVQQQPTHNQRSLFGDPAS